MESAVLARVQAPRPHSLQADILYHPARFQVAFCGRRFGKTELGVDKVLLAATDKPGIYWWVGLSWKSASMKRAWRLFCQRTRSFAQVKETEKLIILPNESEIWLRTADNPDSLAGEGLRGVVLDEFSLMSEVVWTEYVRASLSDFKGWALFIGVPKGRNWAAALYDRGVDPLQPSWQSWQIPSSANPFLDPLELEDARKDLTERVYQQEYLAQILSDGGAVFRFINEAKAAKRQDIAVPYHVYVIGCDWAQVDDFSVFTVLDVTSGEAVYIDRSNHVDYSLQIDRLTALQERFQAVAIISERTGNRALSDFLHNAKYTTWAGERVELPVWDFDTTNESKSEVIQALALAFEKRLIKIPNDPVLIGELEAFTSERLPSGKVRYSAPEGLHDDCVMSLAFAWSDARRMPRDSTMPARDRIILKYKEKIDAVIAAPAVEYDKAAQIQTQLINREKELEASTPRSWNSLMDDREEDYGASY